MVILPALAVGKELSLYQILLIAAVCLWGLRLTANWAYTFHGLTAEDWRYRMLREKTGIFYPVINFVGIPMADGRQSKKPGFAQYKNETRMLLPIKKLRRP